MVEKKRTTKSLMFTDTETKMVENVQNWHAMNFSETTLSLFTAESQRIEKIKTERNGREIRSEK